MDGLPPAGCMWLTQERACSCLSCSVFAPPHGVLASSAAEWFFCRIVGLACISGANNLPKQGV